MSKNRHVILIYFIHHTNYDLEHIFVKLTLKKYFFTPRHDRKGRDLRDRIHQRREGAGNLESGVMRDRDHRNRGEIRRSGSGGSNRNVTLHNSRQTDHSLIEKVGSNRQASKDEELRRKRQQMEEETHKMEIKVRRKRERSKDRDYSKDPGQNTEKHHRTSSEHSRNKKSKKYPIIEEAKKGPGDMLQAVDDAIAEVDADQQRSGEEEVSSDEKIGSGESDGSIESRYKQVTNLIVYLAIYFIANESIGMYRKSN